MALDDELMSRVGRQERDRGEGVGCETKKFGIVYMEQIVERCMFCY